MAPVVVLLLLCAAAAVQPSDAHNITKILAQHPSFSTFNHYLTITHLASEINRRRTITVCAVDNAAMNDLLNKHLPLSTITNILSLHVFADYFGAKKLHEITQGFTTTSSLFQATGEADGTSGYVNITDMKGGKVGFSPVDADSNKPVATFVKSIEESPYDIAVIQISHILSSPEVEAPAAAPTDINVTSLMAKHGCKEFSDLIIQQGVDEMFRQSVQGGGLTVFCPSGEKVKAFMPKYGNLSSEGKASLLLYHGVPIYSSLEMLRSSNGVVNTLATEGAKKYDFTVQNDGDGVKLETKVVTATTIGTLVDEDPLSVLKIDKVLQPTELFKEAPSSTKKSDSTFDDDSADSPGPASDDDAAADETSGGAFLTVAAAWFLTVSLASSVTALVVLFN